MDMWYFVAKITHIFACYLSCSGGMAEKRRAGELTDRRQHRHPCRPQPHHQRSSSLWLGQLQLPGQQHRGQEAQRDSHRYSVWYAILSSPVIAFHNPLLWTNTLFTCHFRSICLACPASLHKRLRDPSPCFPLKCCVPSLFWRMYYSKTQFTASHLKSMCTLWKEISHCVS